MSHDESKRPDLVNQHQNLEPPTGASECGLPNDGSEGVSVESAMSSEANVAINVSILFFSVLATVVLCGMNMGTHRGATRSEVQLQERRQIELEQALAEQEAYLSKAVADAPITLVE